MNKQQLKFEQVVAELSKLQEDLFLRALQNQKQFDGAKLLTESGDYSGQIANSAMCYNFKKGDFMSEKNLSFDDFLASLPSFWTSPSKETLCGNSGVVWRVNRQLATVIEYKFEISVLCDSHASPFDMYSLYSEKIMDMFVEACHGNCKSGQKSMYQRTWLKINWFLNNYDCFCDDVLRNQFANSSAQITHQIAAAFYAALTDMVMAGLLVFYDNFDQPDQLYIVHADAFMVSFVKHLWQISGLAAYPRGEEYDWDTESNNR